jgi:hypothetical protein
MNTCQKLYLRLNQNINLMFVAKFDIDHFILICRLINRNALLHKFMVGCSSLRLGANQKTKF